MAQSSERALVTASIDEHIAPVSAGYGAVSMLPGRSTGGRGRGRVADDVETVAQDVLRARHLHRQEPSVGGQRGSSWVGVVEQPVAVVGLVAISEKELRAEMK